MGLLNATLLTALQSNASRAFWLLDLVLPDATRRWGPQDVAAPTAHYSGKILSVSPYRRECSDRDGGLITGTVEMSVADHDREFAKVIAGRYANTVLNSTATLKLGHADVASANWFTDFTGRLANWTMNRAHVYVLTLRNDDVSLEKQVPPALIVASDWPNCPPENLGRPIPMLYGTHSSSTGAVPLIYVTRAAPYRYLVCIGAAKSIDTVYKDGVALGGGLWQVKREWFNGIYYTWIDFLGVDQQDASITANVKGYETVGDGSGTLIDNPADILKHLLTNFAFNDSRGTWFSTPTQIDTASFTAAATFCTDQGYKGGRYLPDQTSVRALLDEICQQFGLIAYFNHLGKIALDFEEHRVGALGDVYPTDPPAIIAEDEIGESFQIQRDEQVVSRIFARAAALQPSGIPTWAKNAEVRDITNPVNVSEVLSQEWVTDPATALVPARLVASRRLYLHRQPRGRTRVTGPLHLINLAPLDDVLFRHWAGPEAAGLGWGEKKWQQRLFRVRSRTVDPSTNTVTVEADDVRYYLSNFRELNLLSQSVDSAATVDQNTNARLDHGNTHAIRDFTRADVAYEADVVQPAGLSESIKTISAGVPKYASAGLLIERSRANQLIQSSFKNWSVGLPTGWTVTAGSGTVSEETATLLFDASGPRSCLKIVAGSPHSVETTIVGTATSSFASGMKVVVSYDHIDTTYTPRWRLQRAVDGNYWNDGVGAFGPGPIDNVGTLSGLWTRELSKVIPVGGSATTLTLSFAVPSGATDGAVIRIGHAEIDTLNPAAAITWAGSRIVTEASSVAQAADAYKVTNNTGRRAWPATRGTAATRFVPLFGADADTLIHTLWYAFHDADNWDWIRYDRATAAFQFVRKAGGVTYTASLPLTVTRGTSYHVVGRWTSSEGELGLAANTISILVAPGYTKASVTAAALTEVATADLYIGHANGADHADAYLGLLWVTPQVLTDEECWAARG